MNSGQKKEGASASNPNSGLSKSLASGEGLPPTSAVHTDDGMRFRARIDFPAIIGGQWFHFKKGQEYVGRDCDVVIWVKTSRAEKI